eukprot:SAG22_NODE_1159_length_5326_cov_3.375741_2_plen_455_part_00
MSRRAASWQRTEVRVSGAELLNAGGGMEPPPLAGGTAAAEATEAARTARAATSAPPLKRVSKPPTFVREEHRQPLYAVCVEPFDQLGVFAAVGGDTVSVYRVMPNGFLDIVQSYTDGHDKESFMCCCWSRGPDDVPWLCVAGGNGAIKVINMATQGMDAYLYGHGGDINDMKTWPQDSNIVLTASKDESLRLWNLATGVCLAIFAGSKGHCGDVLHCDFDASGDRFCSCGMDSCIKIWSMSDPVVAASIQASYRFSEDDKRKAQFEPAAVQFPVFSTNRFHMNYVDCVLFFGDLLFSKSVHSSILLWQPRKFSSKQSECEDIQLAQFEFERGDLWFVKFDLHRPRLLLATGTTDGRIYVWRLAAKTLEPRLLCILSNKDCKACIRQVTFEHDGNAILCCCDDATIWRYDLGELGTTEDDTPAAAAGATSATGAGATAAGAVASVDGNGCGVTTI